MKLADPERLHCFVPNSRTIRPNGEGRLSGKSAVVKDLFAIKGVTASFGNARWRETHEPATENAAVVDTLLANGATIVGITKMDQMAYSIIGNIGEGEAPVNPRYPDRFTGGSSSGSASAVAGGIADIGIGTDTAGSIRVPAAACGLFGMRPTHSAIDVKGVIPWAQSLDTVGVLARNANTLADTADILLKKGVLPYSATPRFLLPADVGDVVDGRTFEVVKKAGDAISRKLNASIESVDLSYFLAPSITDLYARVQGREIWANHQRWVEKNSRYLVEEVRTRFKGAKAASEAPESEKLADIRARHEYTKKLEKIVGEDGILILPVIPELMPLLTSTPEMRQDFRSRTVRLATMGSFSGMPEAVIPFYEASSKLTIGVGLMSQRATDRRLLEIAARIAGNSEHVEIR